MRRFSKGAWLTLATVLLLPLVSMMVIPFYDTSEPRYAEIARIMVQTGDWVTPWFSPGVPFWGKPPLSFWAQALSMKAFGFTEFAARFPSWVSLLLSIAILLTGLKSLRGPRVALWACIIYSTCTLVYISSGAVLTDPFLALGTTLSMISFAMAVQGQKSALANQLDQQEKPAPTQGCSRWWPYGFFLGLAIGLLAKGPLALVLSFAPIVVWWAFNRKSVKIIQALPWAKGLALVAVLTLPWYILAEIKTPGFLDYFIVGEHFRRFLDPGWAGDLYGTAHRHAYGTIWLYWLQASFPWGIMALAAIIAAPGSLRVRNAMKATSNNPLSGYWLANALFTPLFFTSSANILWTYVLPSLAGFCVLMALFADELYQRFNVARRRLLSIAGIVPTVVFMLSMAAWLNPDLRNTERSLVRYIAQQDDATIPLFYLSDPPFSAQFYSSGRVQSITQSELPQAIKLGMPFYLAIPKEEQNAVAHILGKPPKELYANKRYILVKVPGARATPTEVRGQPL